MFDPDQVPDTFAEVKHSNPVISRFPIIPRERSAAVILSVTTPSDGSIWVVTSSVSLITSVRVVFRDQVPSHQPAKGTTIEPLPPVVPEEVLPPQPLNVMTKRDNKVDKIILFILRL